MYYGRPTNERPRDSESSRCLRRRSKIMKRAGATIVDPAAVDLASVRRAQNAGTCRGFKYDLNRYLAGLGSPPFTRSRRSFARAAFIRRYSSASNVHRKTPTTTDPRAAHARRKRTICEQFRAAVLTTMDGQKLDAFIYPTWSNPPRLIGDLNTPHGDNSQVFSPTTGFPAINVPMGYTRGEKLPAGLTIFGRPWDESTLIRLAYSYEQATHHRRPPATTPAVR